MLWSWYKTERVFIDDNPPSALTAQLFLPLRMWLTMSMARASPSGHQSLQVRGKPALHLVSSLSETWAGKQDYIIALS
jgi:hypothetical protein